MLESTAYQPHDPVERQEDTRRGQAFRGDVLENEAERIVISYPPVPGKTTWSLVPW